MAEEPDAAAAAAAAAAAKPWYDGADPTFIGELERRGIKDKSPLEAARNFYDAHVAAEKLIGAPANELVRWPKDANDTTNWQQLRSRLGVPSDAKEYDFSSVKFQDGSELDPSFAEFLRSTAHGLNIPKDAATQLAAKFAGFLESQETADTAATTAARAAEQQALRTSWGQNYEANRVAATTTLERMLEASGMKKEDAASAINALENQVGGAKVMEMFRAFSTMTREDNYVQSGQGGGNVVSFQEAQATKAALLRDQGFVERWNKGDVTALQQLDALERVIVANTPESDEAIFRRQLAEQGGRR
jgi:hypothetical protein